MGKTFGATTDELNEMFPTGDYYGNKFKDEQDSYGITYMTADKDNNGGVLIRFADMEESLKPHHIIHEAIHAAGRICEYVGIDADWNNDEAFCYLATWVVKCCTTAAQREKDITDETLQAIL